MQLADFQIKYLAEKCNMITPFSPVKVEQDQGQRILSWGLESFGYGLRLAETAVKYTLDDSLFIGRTVDTTSTVDTTYTVYAYQDLEKSYLRMPAGETILVTTIETLEIPEDCIGIFCGKSTYARSGMISYTTVFEPGWKGRPTIMLHNTRRVTVYLPVGEGIGQMVFFQGERPVEVYNGKYQNAEDVQEAK